jgi:hypothetical protein
MAAKTDMSKIPLILGTALSMALNTGPYAVISTAQRLGIKPVRMPNRRTLYSFEQAEAIGLEMLKQARG